MTQTVRKPELEHSDANRWSEYQIEAKTSLADRALRTLKCGDAFGVMDTHGDVGTVPQSADGIYVRDTRFLSHFELRLHGQRPLLLSSEVHEDKAALSVELTNPDILMPGDEKLRRDTIFVQRTKFLWNSVCYERVSAKNYSSERRRLQVNFLYEADFCDMFEIRGTSRLRRGRVAARLEGNDATAFRYVGLDGVERETRITFSPAPVKLEKNHALIELELEPYQSASLFITVVFQELGADIVTPQNFFFAYRDTRRARREATGAIATIASSNPSFDEVINRATSDVYTLITRGPLGKYPYAGIPWFNTIFGRDGIVTAIFMLWIDPSIACGVLRTLAAIQADGTDPAADAQPGKIVHEIRYGEMARLGEVPFRRYYGTVDATPLFIVLAGLYFERTGDLDTIRGIWPNIRAALNWIDRYGDLDGDGFVEYHRAKETGLANQGWKDSHDSIFHADGSGAEGPIALCEVQGYVFAAKRHAMRLAALFGDTELATRLALEAENLRLRFESTFWCDDIGTYALAIDGDKRPCRVVASNAGHVLFAGIASPERAYKVMQTLLDPTSFSGWGIRTLAVTQPRYNPMSYHNGSVWPHDNALIALGFANYGLKVEAARVFAGIFEAARHQDSSRLPELFCGFTRRPNRAPTPYPVACAPQAWAAAAVHALLSCCLGLGLVHERNEIHFRDPAMPDFLDEVIIRNLRLGTSRLDVRLHRYGTDVTANVLSREGDPKVVILK